MQPFLREMNLTEARRQLSVMLREIENDPGVGYQIKVRDRVVAELRSPSVRPGTLSSGASLLQFARDMESLHPRKPGRPLHHTAANYKEHLYGAKRPVRRKKRA
jgi:hypothetical protein